MGTSVAIRPSALGAKGLLLFAAMQFAFLATNYSNLFFLTLAFSAALGVFGAFWSYRNLQGLRVLDIQVERAAAGAARSVQLQVDGKRRSRFDLTFQVALDQGHQAIGYAPWIRGVAGISDSLSGQPRSVRVIDSIRVTSRYPFGFFKAYTTLPVHCELITHPAPAPLTNDDHAVGHADDGHLLTAGRGSALAGLREFRHGDTIADIHWKATARRAKAVAKERERESDSQLDVVLDRRCEDEALERALSQLTTLVFAARHRAPLTIYSQGFETFVDPDRGGTHEALRWLAQATTLPSDAPAPPRRRAAIHFPNSPRSAP